MGTTCLKGGYGDLCPICFDQHIFLTEMCSTCAWKVDNISIWTIYRWNRWFIGLQKIMKFEVGVGFMRSMQKFNSHFTNKLSQAVMQAATIFRQETPWCHSQPESGKTRIGKVIKFIYHNPSLSRCRFAYGPADHLMPLQRLLLQCIQIGFTFLVLPFWCRLTWVVRDKIQEGHKMVVCVFP